MATVAVVRPRMVQRMCVRSRVRVCLHVSVRLCKGAAHQVPLEDMSSRRACSILIRVQKKRHLREV